MLKRFILILISMIFTALLSSCGHEHVFDEWTLVKDSTCSESGSQTRKCAECEEAESAPVEKKPHRYKSKSDGWKSTEIDGVTVTYSCADCEAIKEDALPFFTAPEWFKIGSYNLLSCFKYDPGSPTTTQGFSIDETAAAIFELGLDIIALQEVDVNRASSSDENSGLERDQVKYITKYLTEKTGVKHYSAFGAGLFHNSASAEYENDYGYETGAGLYGIAIISKFPILSYRAVPLAFHEGYDESNPSTYYMNGYERRILLIADVLVGDEVLTVINTHLDLKADARIASISVLEKEMGGIKNPIILMGDMNAQRYSSEIRYITEHLLTPALPPFRVYPTYPSKNPTRQIDWIFVSDDFEFRDFTVSDADVSDHRPILVTVRLKDDT